MFPLNRWRIPMDRCEGPALPMLCQSQITIVQVRQGRLDVVLHLNGSLKKKQPAYLNQSVTITVHMQDYLSNISLTISLQQACYSLTIPVMFTTKYHISHSKHSYNRKTQFKVLDQIHSSLRLVFTSSQCIFHSPKRICRNSLLQMTNVVFQHGLVKGCLHGWQNADTKPYLDNQQELRLQQT